MNCNRIEKNILSEFSQYNDQAITELLMDSPEASVFHTPEFRRVVAETFNDAPAYWVYTYDGRIIAYFPSFVRKQAAGTVMNSMPVSGAYGGVCTLSPLDDQDKDKIVNLLMQDIIEHAEKNHWIAFTVIPPPHACMGSEYRKSIEPDFVYDRFTQITDLEPELNYKPSVRNHIKQAEKKGVQVETQITAQNLKAFYDVYCANMDCLNIRVKPISYFDNIIKHLIPKGMAKFYLGYITEEKTNRLNHRKMIAGLLVLRFKETVISHETVMLREYKSLSGTSYLLDAALRDSKASGYKWFNWGASSSKDSGVYKFKKAWGPTDYNYSYFTKIIGKINRLKEIPLEQIKQDFKWHYVAPYQVFNSENAASMPPAN